MPILVSCPQKTQDEAVTSGAKVNFYVVDTAEPWVHVVTASVQDVSVSLVGTEAAHVRVQYELRHELHGPAGKVPFCATQDVYETNVTDSYAVQSGVYKIRKAIVAEVFAHLEKEASRLLETVLKALVKEGGEVADGNAEIESAE